MSEQPELRFEIGHVLFIDIVGYSKLLINEQTEQIETLRKIVRQTEQVHLAEEQGKLLRLPAGDGGALVFQTSPEAPVACAVEIAQALKAHPQLAVRMGVHSGPVNQVADLNEQANIAGAGVDIAQRVMSCGDAGHILLSKRVADDLSPYPKWNRFLHDLGEFEVKHGAKIGLVNFFTDDVGNPTPPSPRRPGMSVAVGDTSAARRSPIGAGRIGVAALLIVGVAIGFLMLWRHPSRHPASSGSGALSPAMKSVAVLPFENTSNDPNAEYLAEGISEALINSLAELQQLRVIARATAFHYKGKEIDARRVGHELNVAAVLTGKVRQVQDALSVQVDLVDATTGAQLWGSAFDRKMSDVIAVKQAIAKEVTDKLKLKLSGDDERRLVKRDSRDPAAYAFYLRGRYFWNKRTPDSLKQAIEQFQQAIDRDPNFALGYTGLADSHILLQQYAGIRSSDAMPKARAAVNRALQIDDSLAEAHASSAVTHQFAWEWVQAEEEYRRAIALNDNYATAHHWYGTLLEVRLQWDAALREIKRAQELDPLSPIISANLAIIYLAKNDLSSAIDVCQKVIDLDPNHPAGHDWLGWAYFKAGRKPEAITEREKSTELSKRAPPQLASLGYVYAVTGRQAEASAMLKELEDLYAKREAAGQYLAMIWEGLGHRDEAFASLESDFQQHSAELQFITWRVQFDQLRNDPRYADLIRRMGLTP